MPRLSHLLLLPTLLTLATTAHAATSPTLSAWLQNTTHLTGHSTNATVNAAISSIPANVQQVRYTATDAYINATGIPSYDIGPFPGDPNLPANQNRLVRFPLTPQAQTGPKTATGLGAIGTWVNGVAIFNPKDAASYNNQNTWHTNAVINEASSFDAALGHPEQTGDYHHHQHPVSLNAQLNDNGTHDSPILGFAFDGFPIYGDYMNANTDGTGPVTRMTSSYSLRSITTRTTLVNTNPDGSTTTGAAPFPGPAVSAASPLGTYVEDYQYVKASGLLDQFNGRFTVTPDYPLGTYAYFATVDANGNSAYPYIVGPQYFGTLASDDTANTVSVPNTALVFTSIPEPTSLSLLALTAICLLPQRRRHPTNI